MKPFDLVLRVALPIAAAVGLAFAVAVAARTGRPAPTAEPVTQPATAPFESYIAGAGLIESLGRNIDIATPVAGVIDAVFVRVGDRVERGAPLFKVEGRDAEAELRVRETAVVSAEAKIAEAEGTLEDYQQQLRNAERISDLRAISSEEFTKRRANVVIYAAKLRQSEADLENARAQLQSSHVAVERRTVRAPIDGQVLQLNARPGEYAAASVNSTPLLMLGETRRFAVRVDIDENDAWRFRSGEPARAYVRGNRQLAADLSFEYVEPYVKPKTSLTGSSTERVDTRVLQVVFSFANDAMPAYVGQQVDVFVRAPAPPTIDAGSPVTRAAASANETRRP
jgi:HlyD family secretion protein